MLYLAGNVGNSNGGAIELGALRKAGGDASVMLSYFYDADLIRAKSQLAGSVMLDSGAFTFMAKGKTPDIDSYVEGYASCVKRNGVRLYFELDLDSLIGYGRVKAIRDELEREVGWPPIPVWHKSLGTREFSAMAERYPYVAIGGIAAGDITRREYQSFPWFIQEAHRHGAKIHGLGFTNLKLLPRYHFDSVDSAAHVTGVRFGRIYRFDGSSLRVLRRPPGTRYEDYRRLWTHNFCEWAKFSRYVQEHY